MGDWIKSPQAVDCREQGKGVFLNENEVHRAFILYVFTLGQNSTGRYETATSQVTDHFTKC